MFFIVWSLPVSIHFAAWSLRELGLLWRGCLFLFMGVFFITLIAYWLGACFIDFALNDVKTDFVTIFTIVTALLNMFLGSWCAICAILDPFTCCWAGAAFMMLATVLGEGGSDAEYVIHTLVMLATGLITAFNVLVLYHTTFIYLAVFGIWVAPLVLYVIMLVLKKLMS